MGAISRSVLAEVAGGPWQAEMIVQLPRALQSGNHLIMKTKQFGQTVSCRFRERPLLPYGPNRRDSAAENSFTTWCDSVCGQAYARDIKFPGAGGSKEREVKVTILGRWTTAK